MSEQAIRPAILGSSMLRFYKAVDLVYTAGNEKLVQTVSAANGEVFQLTNSFIAKFGKKAKRYVIEFINNEKCNQKFTDQMNAVIKRISDDQPGFFSNISLPKLPKLRKFNIFNKK